ncbi:MAG: hypothetical protein LBU51_10165 [Bacteroidales bacterium]|jgi:L-lactate utilization protein LutB|nr:hypothetical protein [Bacteroidales bacterium]
MFIDNQIAKIQANKFRFSYFEEMDKHLLTFEKSLLSNDIDIIWINNKSKLIDAVSEMMTKANYNKICYASKTITEEIKNEKKLFQHISAEDFLSDSDFPEFLFLDADYGIVDSGEIVLLDNPLQKKINQVNHLVLFLSIDKLLLKSAKLDTILYLANYNKEKTNFPTNILLISSAFNKIENKQFGINNQDLFDSKKVEITLFLYDFNVTNLLKDETLRNVLYCIDCGKCKTVCPVYAVKPSFSPIELLKYNAKLNLKNRNTLAYTTLCGNCNDVCPVLIPFTSLLQSQMKEINTNLYKEVSLNKAKIYTKRSRLNKLNNKFRRNLYCRRYFGSNKKLYNYFNAQKSQFYNVSKHVEEQ